MLSPTYSFQWGREDTRRPRAGVAHIDSEDLAVFARGRAERPDSGGQLWDETLVRWTAHYGSSPLEWAGTSGCTGWLRPGWSAMQVTARKHRRRSVLR